MRNSFSDKRFGRGGGPIGARRGGRFALGLLMLAGVAALGAVVMLLWNWLMPSLFTGINRIDYWHALALLLLCKILFGFGHGGFGHERRWRKHWQDMSAEERAQLKAQVRMRFKAQFGDWNPFDDRDETPKDDAR